VEDGVQPHRSTALEKFDQSPLALRVPLFQRRPSVLALSKMAVHLAAFQPATSAAYLLL